MTKTSSVSKSSSVRRSSATRAVSAVERAGSQSGTTAAVAPIEDIVNISPEAHKYSLHAALERLEEHQNDQEEEQEASHLSPSAALDDVFFRLIEIEEHLERLLEQALPLISQSLPRHIHSPELETSHPNQKSLSSQQPQGYLPPAS